MKEMKGPLCFPRSSFLRDQIGSQVGYRNFCSFSGCRHVTGLSRRHFLNASSDYYALSQYLEKFTKQKLSFGWNGTEKISVPKASGTVTYEYNSTSRIVNMQVMGYIAMHYCEFPCGHGKHRFRPLTTLFAMAPGLDKSYE